VASMPMLAISITPLTDSEIQALCGAGMYWCTFECRRHPDVECGEPPLYRISEVDPASPVLNVLGHRCRCHFAARVRRR
jgi:hypothetical protein